MSGMVSTALAAHVNRALKISKSERTPSTRRGVATVVTHSSNEDGASSTSGADDADDEPGSTPSEAMMEFAEAGFPSDEDDVMDPRARDRAMNRVVEEIQELNKAEEEVLTAAFDLVEKLMPGSTKRSKKSAGEEVEEA